MYAKSGQHQQGRYSELRASSRPTLSRPACKVGRSARCARPWHRKSSLPAPPIEPLAPIEPTGQSHTLVLVRGKSRLRGTALLIVTLRHVIRIALSSPVSTLKVTRVRHVVPLAIVACALHKSRVMVHIRRCVDLVWLLRPHARQCAGASLIHASIIARISFVLYNCDVNHI
eukprot:COSAG06_NODE_1568_length_9074_cov_5.196212_6_plen_172_part_00